MPLKRHLFVMVIVNCGNSPSAYESWFVSARSEMFFGSHAATAPGVAEAAGAGVEPEVNAEINVQIPEMRRTRITSRIARRRQ